MRKLMVSVLFFFCVAAVTVAAFAQERMTLVTYYPSPRGVYREMRVLGNNNAEVRLGVVTDAVDGNGDVAGLVIADTSEVHPQIQFQNTPYVAGSNTADFVIAQTTDDDMSFIHQNNNSNGRFTFATHDAAGNVIPALVRAGEIVRCSSF